MLVTKNGSCISQPRFRFKKRKKRGFLLVDIIIALLIGMAGVGLTALVLTSAASAANVAQQSNLAMNCARQVVENIRLRRKAVLQNGNYSDARVFGAVPSMVDLERASVSAVISDWREGAKTVHITVFWKSGSQRNATRRYTVTALVAPRGVSL